MLEIKLGTHNKLELADFANKALAVIDNKDIEQYDWLSEIKKIAADYKNSLKIIGFDDIDFSDYKVAGNLYLLDTDVCNDPSSYHIYKIETEQKDRYSEYKVCSRKITPRGDNTSCSDWSADILLSYKLRDLSEHEADEQCFYFFVEKLKGKLLSYHRLFICKTISDLTELLQIAEKLNKEIGQ